MFIISSLFGCPSTPLFPRLDDYEDDAGDDDGVGGNTRARAMGKNAIASAFAGVPRIGQEDKLRVGLGKKVINCFLCATETKASQFVNGIFGSDTPTKQTPLFRPHKISSIPVARPSVRPSLQTGHRQ